MIEDGYNYFSAPQNPLVMADYDMNSKSKNNEDYHISSKTIQVIPRDRLVQRQTYDQNQKLDNINRPITMNDGDTDRIIIGFAEDGFSDGS